MSFFQKIVSNGLRSRISRGSGSLRYWALPVTLGAGWLLWPAIDLEWKMALGLAPDPEESIKKVHAARMQRMELVLGRQATVVLASPKEDEGEEEEEDEGKDDATEDNGDEDAEGDEGDEEGGDEEGEEEDEEEKKIEIKPLYVIATPAQGIKLSIQQMWDNFAVKAVRMTEEDDDEEDE